MNKLEEIHLAYQKLNHLLTIFIGIISIFHPKNKIIKHSIALNILQHSDEKISHVSKSEFSKTREKQVILLIITDGQKQYHTFVKKINSLLKKKYACSENYCLNYLKPFISIKLRGNAFLLS